MTTSLGYTSVPALLKYIRQGEALGLDIDAALQAAGISQAQLADNSQRIPSEVHERLIAHFIEVSGDPLCGLPRTERVADTYTRTVRTLQRHLQLAGTSYQEILDALRQELAEHYLLRSDLPIQDIASYLGFTESRSFHRSFKGWTGMTPGEYRQRHADDA